MPESEKTNCEATVYTECKSSLKMFTLAKITVFLSAPRGNARATSVTSTSALNCVHTQGRHH